MRQIITAVQPDSIGEELGLEAGDSLLAIDGQEIEDILDYYFLTEAEELTLTILTKDGDTVDCQVEKDETEELGLVFEDAFMGTYQHCHNHCIFCFIDQLPKGLRKSLYFKDDDSRLSFISGNYITMTNMSEADFDKIIRYRMEPINISVHTTDPELRCKMLRNPKAADIMTHLKRLAAADITMNGQIVLCKNINDKAALDKSIKELSMFRPQLQSVSVVPVGLSRHRQGLYELEPFTEEDCRQVIDQIEKFQRQFFAEDGRHFIHASDEFYIKAGRPLPEEERYDGYLQIENGVGMMRLFWNEAEEALQNLKEISGPKRSVSVVTAPLASSYIRALADKVEALRPGLEVKVHVIVNHFFGEDITVSGLLTGTDIISQLKNQNLGSKVLLPGNLLRAEGDLLLDDVSLPQLEAALQVPVSTVSSSGADFIQALAAI